MPARKLVAQRTPNNPFRIHGVVGGEFFTDRAAEIARVRRTLREPAAKLLVYGERRMGKTSAILRAVELHRRTGGHVIAADLSTASSVADIGNRILQAAGTALGRSWKEFAAELASRLKGSIGMKPDPVTGHLVPSFNLALRDETIDQQRRSLGDVLDTLDAMAGDQRTTLGVVLDEFQEIHKFGGEDAEWHLRGVIQQHRHLTYVLSGSKPHLVRRMLEKGRAFYQMFDVLPVGAIDAAHMERWIDERLANAERTSRDAGARCVALAGPRTRDIVQLARKVYDRVEPAGEATVATVDAAFVELVEESDDGCRAIWNQLTPLQQNVLRAVAGASVGLTTAASVTQFGLKSGSSATHAASALLNDGRLLKSDTGARYVFDNPFMRGWVVVRALPDVGIIEPATHRP